MNRPALIFIATLLLSLSFLASTPRSARACDPMQPGVFLFEELNFDQPVPLNGAWAFRAVFEQASLSDLSVEVRDMDDQLVEGTLSQVAERRRSSATEDDFSQSLIIWTPADLLRPDHEYRVAIRNATSDDPFMHILDEQTTFRSSAASVSDYDVALPNDFPSLSVKEGQGGIECCEDPTMCNSCGGCTNCWATRTIYQVMLNIDVIMPDSDTDLQTYHRLEDSSGAFETFWNRRGVQSNSLLFPEGETGRFCATVQTFALATQELVDEEELCFTKDTLPESTPIEGVTRPETCEDAPDAGGGSDAGELDAGKMDADHRDTTGQPDIAEEPNGPDADAINPLAGNDLDRGCGCSSTPTSPSSLLGMMLFLAALGVSRRAFILRQS